MPETQPYKRALLKLSGEVLQNAETGDSLDPAILQSVAAQIKEVHELGVQLGIVVGGGNIFRGLAGMASGIDRTDGDNMGMLATMINSLALKTAFEQAGLKARVMSALDMPKIAEPMRAELAINYLEAGEIMIFGAGTGNPFFTTDSAAALRAAEIKASVLLKATKVDGIYSADPMKDPEAKRYADITYRQALGEQLRIMDAAAFSLCMDNDIPIIVFNFFKEREIVRVLQGEPSGTLVHQ